MLGFIAAEVQAAPAAATTRPVHRRKPTAGNYTPVYRLYRGHSRRKKGFFGLFKHRSKARHSSAASPKSKGRRGTLERQHRPFDRHCHRRLLAQGQPVFVAGSIPPAPASG